MSYLQIGPAAPARDPLSTPLRELPVNKQHVLKDQLPSVFSQNNLFSKGKVELSILKNPPMCLALFITDSNIMQYID